MVDYDKKAFFTGRKIAFEDLLDNKSISAEDSYVTWNRYASVDDNELTKDSYLAGYESAIMEDNFKASSEVTEEDLVILAEIANAFDASGDVQLQKEASVLDELLLTIASPKNAIAKITQAYDDEIEKLRAKYRGQALEEKYSEPRQKLDELNGNKEAIEAVEKTVKKYRPLEAALSTRYSPDHPGLQLMRISDDVYQDPITGKMYDYKNGYTTDKGNKVPGGAVELQSQETFNQQYGSVFSTREQLLAGKGK